MISALSWLSSTTRMCGSCGCVILASELHRNAKPENRAARAGLSDWRRRSGFEAQGGAQAIGDAGVDADSEAKEPGLRFRSGMVLVVGVHIGGKTSPRRSNGHPIADRGSDR